MDLYILLFINNSLADSMSSMGRIDEGGQVNLRVFE